MKLEQTERGKTRPAGGRVPILPGFMSNPDKEPRQMLWVGDGYERLSAASPNTIRDNRIQDTHAICYVLKRFFLLSNGRIQFHQNPVDGTTGVLRCVGEHD